MGHSCVVGASFGPWIAQSLELPVLLLLANRRGWFILFLDSSRVFLVRLFYRRVINCKLSESKFGRYVPSYVHRISTILKSLRDA